MLDVIKLTPEEVAFAWPRLEPFIQKAIDLTDGEVSLTDIKIQAMWGRLLFLVVYEEREIWAVAVLEVVEYPQFRVLRCMLLAGQELEKWEHFEAELERQAILNGCSYVEGLVRPGIAKKALPHGYRQRYALIRKRVLGGLQ